MSDHATEIDVAGAEAALEARLAPTRETIEVARDPESKRFTRAEEATPVTGETEGEDPGAAVTETPTEVAHEESQEDIFAHIPDEALTPELLAVKRGMEAAYTRKTQEIAPLRKIQEDYGFESVDDMKQALDSYKTLADPNNWERLHGELTTYLKAQGLPQHAAEQAAAVSLGDAIGDFPDGVDADPDYDDGETQYGSDPRLLQEVAALKQGFTQLQQTLTQEREARSQQEQIDALAAQLTADEQVIRAAHKDMPADALEDYIETVYDLAGDGDLHAAANRIDSMLGRQAAGYLQTKQAALAVPGPNPGAGVIARDDEEPPHTLEEGHERAMAQVRAKEAAERQTHPGF